MHVGKIICDGIKTIEGQPQMIFPLNAKLASSAVTAAIENFTIALRELLLVVKQYNESDCGLQKTSWRD